MKDIVSKVVHTPRGEIGRRRYFIGTVDQLAESMDLKSIQDGFESHGC